jgi:hypothetical protein
LPWVAGLLLLALATVLLVPVRLIACVQTSPRLAYTLEARWFGARAPRITLVDSRRPSHHAANRWRSKRAAHPARARRVRPTRRRLGRGSGSRMLAALPSLLGEVMGSIRWESFRLDAEFGLDDPADTGQLYGCLTPLQVGMPWPPGVCIALRPNFERACLEGELQATLRLRAAALLPPAVRFAWRAFGPRA